MNNKYMSAVKGLKFKWTISATGRYGIWDDFLLKQHLKGSHYLTLM